MLVYVGKTDAEAGLQRRLARHADKIKHRKGLDPSLITFKAIRLYVFTVMDLETELLKSYRPAWNGKGFGSNDPGRERDTTKIKEGNFDEMYPIDIHREISLPDMNDMTADAVLTALRGAVPWKLRSQNLGGRSRKCHIDLLDTVVTLPPPPRTSWNVISAVVQQLPPGWQATALRSHVILYKEAPREYPQPLALEMSLQP